MSERLKPCTIITDMVSGSVRIALTSGKRNMAERISSKLAELGVEFTVVSPTNQIFVALPKKAVTELSKTYKFEAMGVKDDAHDIVRICTSWATKEENVTALLTDIERVLA